MNQYTISVGNLQLDVYVFIYEPVASNMYFIPVGDTGIVFDPNLNEELPPLLERFGINRVQIILTHEHYDHTTGVKWLQDQIEASLFCHQACDNYISSDKGNSPKLVALVLNTKDSLDGGHRYDDFMASYVPYKLKADRVFKDREYLRIGDCSFQCISTPGHSPGSACYILDGRYIFTGDSLIQNTPTILRFRESDKSLYENLTRPFLKTLDKNMLVFPGHGEPFKICESKYL